MMEKFKKIVLGVAVLVGLSLCSCSSNDEPDTSLLDGGTPMDLIGVVTNGELSGVFKKQGWAEEYRKRNDKKDSWHKINRAEESGWTDKDYPLNFIVKDKECLVEYFSNVFSSGYGPSRLGNAWNAYCYQTMLAAHVYIRCDLTYDISSGNMSIGKIRYKIERQNSKGVVLTREYTEWNMNHRFVGTYLLSSGMPDESRMLVYDSCEEFYADALARLRETFGEEVNVNPSLYPDAILDEPVINFDQLEEDLKKENKEFYFSD